MINHSYNQEVAAEIALELVLRNISYEVSEVNPAELWIKDRYVIHVTMSRRITITDAMMQTCGYNSTGILYIGNWRHMLDKTDLIERFY